jgi:hypothetical protein
VSYVGVAGSSGLTVAVRTVDGRFDLSYLHLSATAVHEGDRVGGGDAIGAVGTTGRRSAEQPHLHFGVRDAGARQAYRDPLDFLPPLAPPAAQPQPPAPVATPAPSVSPPAAAPAFGAVEVAVPAAADALVPGAVAAPAAVSAPTAAAPAAHGARPQVSRNGPRAGVHAPRAARVTAADVVAAPAAAPTRAHRTEARAAHLARSAAHLDRQATPVASAGPRSAIAGDAKPAVPSAPAGHARHADAGGGLDLGWLAALIGLVAASLCLGRPQRAGAAARQGRATLGALLGPLIGRT